MNGKFFSGFYSPKAAKNLCQPKRGSHPIRITSSIPINFLSIGFLTFSALPDLLVLPDLPDLLAFLAFLALLALPIISESSTQYYFSYPYGNYSTYNTGTNEYQVSAYSPQVSPLQVSQSYYYPQSYTAQSTYYYPQQGYTSGYTSGYPSSGNTSGYTLSNPLPSTSSNGFFNPGNSVSGYYYQSSPSLTNLIGTSYLQSNPLQRTGASTISPQGGYYFPSGNGYYSSSPGLTYGASLSFPQGEYYLASNNGYYSPNPGLVYGASSGFGSSSTYNASSSFFYPSQPALSFSPGYSSFPNSSGYSGFPGSSGYSSFSNSFYNSALSPFTPFFTSSQFSVSPYYSTPYSINGNLITVPAATRRTAATVASLVLANPTRGMYCFDPVAWFNGGFQVGIWNINQPVRAQSLDADGMLLSVPPVFSVQPTGQTGGMTLFRSDLNLYEGMINAGGPADYFTTVTVDAASATAVTHRRNTGCDFCHPTPPGHIANTANWGKCNVCHNLGNVMHIHAYKAGIAEDDCYRCHPGGCLTSVHNLQVGLWCIDCHGSLLDAENHQMLISGQLGFPHCADCHDPQHSENLPAIFVDSAGHGGIWCINCHAPTHTEIAPPLGYNNCVLCHTTQAGLSWMGPDCKLCHSSSISPHMVTP